MVSSRDHERFDAILSDLNEPARPSGGSEGEKPAIDMALRSPTNAGEAAARRRAKRLALWLMAGSAVIVLAALAGIWSLVRILLHG